MTVSPIHGDVALFIDWENFKISLAAGHRVPNLSALKEEINNHGRVVVAKAYADWVTRSPELRGASQFINDPPALYSAGIEPVYVPTRLLGGGSHEGGGRMVRVKNSVDVKMTADCIEYAHSHPNISTFVLVSGDSDFIHVVNALRAIGKRVLIIGVSWSTSRRLADQVDGLILYDTEVDAVTPVEPVVPPPPPPAPPAPSREPAVPPAASRQAPRANGNGHRPIELTEVIRAIEEFVRDDRKAGRAPLLTSIKQRLARRFPGFDERKVGFSGFKRLMQRAAQNGNIKLVTVGLVDWAMLAEEPDPTEQLPEVTAAIAEQATEEEAAEECRPTIEEQAEQVAAAAWAEAWSEAGPVAPETGLLGATPEDEEAADSGDELDEVPAESGLPLPGSDDPEKQVRRVGDLIIMADSLEHQEGVTHVAFNFLIAEVCKALEQAIQADFPEIVERWGGVYSRGHVMRLIRQLKDQEVFEQGWHVWKDGDESKPKKRRTFLLNRKNPLVRKTLSAHWGIPEDRIETERAIPKPAAELEPAAPTAPRPPVDTSDLDEDFEPLSGLLDFDDAELRIVTPPAEPASEAPSEPAEATATAAEAEPTAGAPVETTPEAEQPAASAEVATPEAAEEPPVPAPEGEALSSPSDTAEAAQPEEPLAAVVAAMDEAALPAAETAEAETRDAVAEPVAEESAPEETVADEAPAPAKRRPGRRPGPRSGARKTAVKAETAQAGEDGVAPAAESAPQRRSGGRRRQAPAAEPAAEPEASS